MRSARTSGRRMENFSNNSPQNREAIRSVANYVRKNGMKSVYTLISQDSEEKSVNEASLVFLGRRIIEYRNECFKNQNSRYLLNSIPPIVYTLYSKNDDTHPTTRESIFYILGHSMYNKKLSGFGNEIKTKQEPEDIIIDGVKSDKEADFAVRCAALFSLCKLSDFTSHHNKIRKLDDDLKNLIKIGYKNHQRQIYHERAFEEIIIECMNVIENLYETYPSSFKKTEEKLIEVFKNCSFDRTMFSPDSIYITSKKEFQKSIQKEI